MTANGAGLVGREGELAATAELLDSVTGHGAGLADPGPGEGRVLVLLGDAGSCASCSPTTARLGTTTSPIWAWPTWPRPHPAGRGYTNREIADRLFLSPRTVASHLYRTYPKLGISERHQLHDLVARAGLTLSPSRETDPAAGESSSAADAAALG